VLALAVIDAATPRLKVAAAKLPVPVAPGMST
jgi:hypothetical protein